MSSSFSRRLQVALLPRDVPSFNLVYEPTGQLPTSGEQTRSTAVVIDTLRFTTTACQALHAGAAALHVAATIEQAKQMAGQCGSSARLCGERHGHRIDGFDLGNSPYEYTQSVVQGRELIFTTTNGTVAIEAVVGLPQIFLAALVNRAALCDLIHSHTTGDVFIVCAGTDGQVTWEDALTAGAIAARLLEGNVFELANDNARLAYAAWRSTVPESLAQTELRATLYKELCNALGGRNLLQAGYQRDLEFASQLDALNVVPHNSLSQPRMFTT